MMICTLQVARFLVPMARARRITQSGNTALEHGPLRASRSESDREASG